MRGNDKMENYCPEVKLNIDLLLTEVGRAGVNIRPRLDFPNMNHVMWPSFNRKSSDYKIFE